MYPLGLGSTTLCFNWLLFSVVVSATKRSYLDEGYGLQLSISMRIFSMELRIMLVYSKVAVGDYPPI